MPYSSGLLCFLCFSSCVGQLRVKLKLIRQCELLTDLVSLCSCYLSLPLYARLYDLLRFLATFFPRYINLCLTEEKTSLPCSIFRLILCCFLYIAFSLPCLIIYRAIRTCNLSRGNPNVVIYIRVDATVTWACTSLQRRCNPQGNISSL